MLIWEGHIKEPFVSNAQLGYLALSTSFQAPEQRVLKCRLHSGEASWGLHTDENRDLCFLLLLLLFPVPASWLLDIQSCVTRRRNLSCDTLTPRIPKEPLCFVPQGSMMAAPQYLLNKKVTYAMSSQYFSPATLSFGHLLPWALW